MEPKVRQKLNYAKKNWPTKVKEYEVKEKQLGERNSMSKTDPDATFMRMKEDHMLNGQLKPGYNCQISTSNQFVTNYSLHQTSTDSTTLETHLQSHKELCGRNPAVLTADAGYGSHENYAMLEREGIKAIVKYGSYEKERTGNQAKNPFNSANFYYNAQEDYYVCPMGQKMRRCGTASQTTTNGFKQVLHRYKAIRCSGCPLRGQCFKGKQQARVIEVNKQLNQYKAKAKALIDSPEGQMHMKRRGVEVESVFGNIKGNHHFKRFMLRSLPKVEIEFGLLVIAQNLRKMAKAKPGQQKAC